MGPRTRRQTSVLSNTSAASTSNVEALLRTPRASTSTANNNTSKSTTTKSARKSAPAPTRSMSETRAEMIPAVVEAAELALEEMLQVGTIEPETEEEKEFDDEVVASFSAFKELKAAYISAQTILDPTTDDLPDATTKIINLASFLNLVLSAAPDAEGQRSEESGDLLQQAADVLIKSVAPIIHDGVLKMAIALKRQAYLSLAQHRTVAAKQFFLSGLPTTPSPSSEEREASIRYKRYGSESIAAIKETGNDLEALNTTWTWRECRDDVRNYVGSLKESLVVSEVGESGSDAMEEDEDSVADMQENEESEEEEESTPKAKALDKGKGIERDVGNESEPLIDDDDDDSLIERRLVPSERLRLSRIAILAQMNSQTQTQTQTQTDFDEDSQMVDTDSQSLGPATQRRVNILGQQDEDETDESEEDELPNDGHGANDTEESEDDEMIVEEPAAGEEEDELEQGVAGGEELDHESEVDEEVVAKSSAAPKPSQRARASSVDSQISIVSVDEEDEPELEEVASRRRSLDPVAQFYLAGDRENSTDNEEEEEEVTVVASTSRAKITIPRTQATVPRFQSDGRLALVPNDGRKRGKFLDRQPDAEKIQFDTQSQSPSQSRSPSLSLAPPPLPRGSSASPHRSRQGIPYIDVPVRRAGSASAKKPPPAKKVVDVPPPVVNPPTVEETKEEDDEVILESREGTGNEVEEEKDEKNEDELPADFEPPPFDDGVGYDNGADFENNEENVVGGGEEEQEEQEDGSVVPQKVDKGKQRQLSTLSSGSAKEGDNRKKVGGGPLVGVVAQSASGSASTSAKKAPSYQAKIRHQNQAFDTASDDSDEDEVKRKRAEQKKAMKKEATKRAREEAEKASEDSDAVDDVDEEEEELEKKKERREKAIKKNRQLKKAKKAASRSSSDSESDSEPEPPRKKNIYKTGRNEAGARIPWSPSEEKLLLEEMAKAPNEWAVFMNRHGPKGTISRKFRFRNSVTLKDKARNIKIARIKANRPIPWFLNRVSVPKKIQEILDNRNN